MKRMIVKLRVYTKICIFYLKKILYCISRGVQKFKLSIGSVLARKTAMNRPLIKGYIGLMRSEATFLIEAEQ